MSKLTSEPVLKTLFRMAVPMLAGTIAFNTYNFVDTLFISKLGTIPLAAMGFTFPVVTFFTFIAGGIGTGVTTLTSHSLGRKNHKDASKIVTHGILMVIIISALISTIGFLTIKHVFTMLGADTQTLPLVSKYMRCWYTGAVFMALPMMGNGILISLGDSKAASSFMVLGAVLNCILDPVMIFGFAGFPAMGMFGAAFATVIAQAISTLWLAYLLIGKHKIFIIKNLPGSSFFHSCKNILRFAIPSILSMILMPVSSAVVTRLISTYGNEAVAAASAAGRVEMFSFIIPMALGMSLVPFVSQNFGGGHIDRIYQARRYSMRFAILYGIIVAALLFATAPFLATLFTNNSNVKNIFVLYIRVISFGFGMMEVHRYCGFFLTGIHRPVLSTILNMVRILILLLPLSFLGSSLFGIKGIFAGRLFTDLMAGTVGIITVAIILKSMIKPVKDTGKM
ncbi:MAG TPA: MATE family efflux transporter [Chitinispirillaceae bacterium]|nr:MATE family efflux transporter [Chitinispirillaceae bacterium]